MLNLNSALIWNVPAVHCTHTHTKKKYCCLSQTWSWNLRWAEMDRGSAGPWPLGCVWGVPGKKVMDRIGVQQQAGTFTQLCMGLKGELIVWFRGGSNLQKHTVGVCVCIQQPLLDSWVTFWHPKKYLKWHRSKLTCFYTARVRKSSLHNDQPRTTPRAPYSLITQRVWWMVTGTLK